MKWLRGHIGQFLMYATAWLIAIAFWAAALQTGMLTSYPSQFESTPTPLNVAAASPSPTPSVSAQPSAHLSPHPHTRHGTHAPTGQENELTSVEPELRELRQELAGRTLPTVAVCIPGNCEGIPTPAAQAAMIVLLKKAGFQVSDLEAIVETERTRWWATLLNEEPSIALSPEDALGFAASGELMRNRYSARILAATDYLIIGQAATRNGQDPSRDESEEAFVEATVLTAPTQHIVTVVLQRSDAATPLPPGNALCGLTETGARCGLATARTIAEHWERSRRASP